MANSDKRRFPRVAIQAQLEISHPSFGVILLKAKNASEGGFFALRGVSPLPPSNTEVKVIIKRFTGAINVEPVSMRVVRVTDEGIGLEFI